MTVAAVALHLVGETGRQHINLRLLVIKGPEENKAGPRIEQDSWQGRPRKVAGERLRD